MGKIRQETCCHIYHRRMLIKKKGQSRVKESLTVTHTQSWFIDFTCWHFIKMTVCTKLWHVGKQLKWMVTLAKRAAQHWRHTVSHMAVLSSAASGCSSLRSMFQLLLAGPQRRAPEDFWHSALHKGETSKTNAIFNTTTHYCKRMQKAKTLWHFCIFPPLLAVYIHDLHVLVCVYLISACCKANISSLHEPRIAFCLQLMLIESTCVTLVLVWTSELCQAALQGDGQTGKTLSWTAAGELQPVVLRVFICLS